MLMEINFENFNDQHYFNYCAFKLLESLTGEYTFQQIIDIAYRLIENPICVFDNSLKYISYSKDAKVDHPIWHEIVNKGSMSHDTVMLFRDEGCFEIDVNAGGKGPFLFEEGSIGFKRIGAHVFIDRKAVATIIVWGIERPLKPVDFKIVELLCSVLSLEMKKSMYINRTKGLAFEYFLKNLMEGRIDKGDKIRQKLSLLDYTVKENIYVLAVDIHEFDRTMITLEFLKNEFESMIPGAKSIAYNDYIVIIISRSKDNPVTEESMEKLNEFFIEHKIFGGLSNCFHDPGEIKRHFEQAARAISLGKRFIKEKALFFYKDLLLEEIIDILEKHRKPEDLCSPALIELLRYDRENNTQYALTLYHFLNNERNIIRTASSLFTHRGTVIYRIKRIQEITGIDLDDSKTRLQLMLSYEILANCSENAGLFL